MLFYTGKHQFIYPGQHFNVIFKAFSEYYFNFSILNVLKKYQQTAKINYKKSN